MGAAKFISEPIEVIAHIHHMKMVVIKFKWGNTVYNVAKMVNKWQVPSGQSKITHYIVECPKQGVSCEIAFDHFDLKWEIVSKSQMVK
ncbi:MAG: hypothetical protein JSS63_13140 [Bacteroidetes bacterium]|nr:hypothetical protein [Bacteroidota bacterium]MBX7047377.1 hypothetical protein [Ignavibacteria bacterium]